MKDAIKLMKAYNAYCKNNKGNLAMSHVWTSEIFTQIIDSLKVRKVDKIGQAFFNYFLFLNRVEEFSCNIGDYSKTRLMRIVGAINTKDKAARVRKFKKIWFDYCQTFLARYEIKSRMCHDLDLLMILDYVDGWKDEESKQKFIDDLKKFENLSTSADIKEME